MKRKFITVFAALILLPAFLFAVPVVVTWEWLLEDPLVTTFRYQVDGENEDNWTVVDSSVTSYTERGLDGTVDHTLYLQQSYDGVHFSGSAVSLAEAMFPPEEQTPMIASEPIPEIQAEESVAAVEETSMVASPAEEAVVTEEGSPVVAEEPIEEAIPVEESIPEELLIAEEPVAAEEMEPMEEEPAVIETAAMVPVQDVSEEPVEVKEAVESRTRTTLTLGGTFNFQDPAMGAYHRYNLQAELGVHRENWITFNKSLGLGLDLGFAYSPYLSTGWRAVLDDVTAFDFGAAFSNFDHAGTISVAPMLNISMGKVDLDLGLGGFFTWGPELASSSGEKFLYGAFAKAALEYHFNKTFSMGASAKYGFVLSEGFSDMPQFAEGTLYMGFSF